MRRSYNLRKHRGNNIEENENKKETETLTGSQKERIFTQKIERGWMTKRRGILADPCRFGEGNTVGTRISLHGKNF